MDIQNCIMGKYGWAIMARFKYAIIATHNAINMSMINYGYP